MLHGLENGTVLILFWYIYTYVYVYGDPLVLLTSSGIFSSHFHWHKSLLYINQFKLLNQKYIKVQCQAKKKKKKKGCWRECNRINTWLYKRHKWPWYGSALKQHNGVLLVCLILWDALVLVLSAAACPSVLWANGAVATAHLEPECGSLFPNFCAFYDCVLFPKLFLPHHEALWIVLYYKCSIWDKTTVFLLIY